MVAPLSYSIQATAVIAAIITFLVLFTIFGNVLVIIAVLTSRSLKAPQNLFLVSLAAADILVATLIIPFSLANELMGYWYFGKTWCEMYLALDVLFCTSSIVHLCAISLDRYWSVSQAIEYNSKRTPKRIKCIILIVWTLAALISLPPLIYKGKSKDQNAKPECKLNEEPWYILSSSICSFFAPCLIMILVYLRIYLIAKRRNRKNSTDKKLKKMAPGLFSRTNKHSLNSSHTQTQCGIISSQEKTGLALDDLHCGVPVLSSTREERNGHSESFGLQPQGENLKHTNGCEPAVMDTVATVKGVMLMPKGAKDSDLSSAKKKSYINREKRFTFVLAVVIGVFVLCWFPFFFTYSLGAICTELCYIPDSVFQFFFWIGYCNSSLNPVIYTIFNQDFRKAFRRILCSHWSQTTW
ncbi:alpha-2B adrenergic receptor [Xenopus tropicalis]|uniref:Alpha-2B adrenergic receptor n=1 Tax=Xenopus tropicalis TaxID=8364 RepID=F6QH01_XENTR|nr:alpha-2B adrenergic receptor [Xenopus tropicalis]|eukprot:XP_002932610.1 PREDICTED: alpha-2B adrenergic receptor [Xenopus tropicalis]